LETNSEDAVLVDAKVVCAGLIAVRMRLRDMLNPLGVSGERLAQKVT
jgi:hypothetical protein